MSAHFLSVGTSIKKWRFKTSVMGITITSESEIKDGYGTSLTETYINCDNIDKTTVNIIPDQYEITNS